MKNGQPYHVVYSQNPIQGGMNSRKNNGGNGSVPKNYSSEQSSQIIANSAGQARNNSTQAKRDNSLG